MALLVRTVLDYAAVITIGSDWRLSRRFTSDRKAIHAALDKIKIEPSGTTALFEAIHLGIDTLRKRGSLPDSSPS